MPYKSEKIKLTKEQDRRIKLTDEQRKEIIEKYTTGLYSQRQLASEYKVSRRLIQFVISPEKYERAKEQRRERQKDGRYKYTKEQWNAIQKEHRHYKQKLYLKGELKEVNDMKVIADLGKLRDGRNVLVLKKANRIEYVVARNYNPDAREGQQWDSGLYIYNLTSLASTISNINHTVGVSRMDEIATRALDYIDSTGQLEDFLYDNDLDLSVEEKEYFELETEDDQDE